MNKPIAPGDIVLFRGKRFLISTSTYDGLIACYPQKGGPAIYMNPRHLVKVNKSAHEPCGPKFRQYFSKKFVDKS